MRLLTIVLAGLVLVGCQSTFTRRSPVGERLASVDGQSLAGKQVRLPQDVVGEPTLLLVGYVQRAQFDIDRWLLGLTDGRVEVRVYEVPTIAGWLPGLFSSAIDNGMRRGIPEEDWAAVVTVYDGADRVVAQTGNENPSNGRILLLDRGGRIVWFWDRGYSVSALQSLREKLASLRRG